jgi:Tol biopolymer transport system component
MGSPRWISEGYATWIEGTVTGHGRPAGVWRPALFRTWALEGQLPPYRDLDGSDAFLAGSHAYLVGSAFIGWLIEREGRGPEVFREVWARMSAREVRSFDAAFEGVFGAPAEELYGLFVVDMMAQALEARARLDAAGGLHEGILFQRSRRVLGDPVVSPDGARLAYSRRGDNGSWGVVVVSTTPDTLTTEAAERRERMLERDPDDVAAVARIPREQKAEATLAPRFGASFRNPRWMPDGEALLVIRDVPAANGRVRPELFQWSWEGGDLRQITSGAEIQEADPAPDGQWAAGIQCKAGRCDVVRIDLATGRVQTLAEGSFEAPYSGPRVSPDGSFVLASQPHEGRWDLVRIPVSGETGARASAGEAMGAASTVMPERIGPTDGAHRFDPAFMGNGSEVVVVSTRGGLLNLERISVTDPTAPPVMLTRTLGSVVAPAPAPDGSIFFLSYHSRGIDLRKLEAAEGVEVPEIPTTLFPVASSGASDPPTLSRNPVPDPLPYGLGTINLSYLPMASWGVEGWSAGGLLQQLDPIGRLTVHLRGAGGAEGLWQGGALAGRLRLGGPSLQAEVFRAEPRGWDEIPTGEGMRGSAGLPSGANASRTTGAVMGGAWERTRDTGSQRLELGGSLEWRDASKADVLVTDALQPSGTEANWTEAGGRRTQAWIGMGWTRRLQFSTHQPTFLVPSFAGQVQVGSTTGDAWTRQRIEATLALRGAGASMILRGVQGRVAGKGASTGALAEAFTLGGAPSLVLDDRVLSHTVPIPYLPRGALRGNRYLTLEAAVGSTPLGEFFVARHRISGGEGGATRAIGIRSTEQIPMLPMVRIPGGTVDGGSAWVLANRETGESGHLRSWIGVRFRP